MSTRLFLPDGVDPVTGQQTKLSSVSPINTQVKTSYQQALGITPKPTTTAPAPAPTTTQTTNNPAAPTTVFVNNSQEYGGFNQMAPPGSTLMFQPNDPGFPTVMHQAEQQGYKVGIWIPQGQGPSDGAQYGNYMASLYNAYHPTTIVSNAETLSKNSAWNDQVVAAVSASAPDANIALAVEPNQTINYKAWTSKGAQIYVETFTGNSATAMSATDAQAAHDSLVAQGVNPASITMLGYRGSAGTAQWGPSPNWWQQNAQSVGSTAGGGAAGGPGSDSAANAGGGTVSGPTAKGKGTPTAPPPGSAASGPKPGGPSNPDADTKQQDWASYYFGSWGLDPGDLKAVVDIMKKYSDSQDAANAAVAYIRGTNWYQVHFPGIQAGIANGLFSDENGYRDYVNRVNNFSMQYLGRPVSTDEITSWLGASMVNGKWARTGPSVDPGTVGKHLEGAAYATANQGDIQYEMGAFGGGRLNAQQLQAAGEQAVGLDSAIGLRLQRAMTQAQNRMAGLFSGQTQNPSLNLGPQGLNAPSLGSAPDLGS